MKKYEVRFEIYYEVEADSEEQAEQLGIAALNRDTAANALPSNAEIEITVMVPLGKFH